MAEMSPRSERRAELAASLAGVDLPPQDAAAALPKRVPVQRTEPAGDEPFDSCDGGFTDFVAAAHILSERRARREELAP